MTFSHVNYSSRYCQRVEETAIFRSVSNLPRWHYAGVEITCDVELSELEGPGSTGAQFIVARISRKDNDPWCIKATRFIHSWGTGPATPTLYTSVDRTAYRLSFPQQAEFFVSRDVPQPIVIRYCTLRSDLGDADLRHLLLDHVLPRVLAHAGRIVLHGALLHINGVAVAILGESGAGKSTLATALANSGAELLSDDGLVIEDQGAGIIATPTYPSLRLWPDSLRQLYDKEPVTSPMTVRSAKRRVHARAMSMRSRLPLGAVFVLQGGAGAAVSVSDTSPAQACVSLVANSFQLDPTDRAAACRTLAALQRVVLAVPVQVLTYPRRFDVLPAVCERIRQASLAVTDLGTRYAS